MIELTVHFWSFLGGVCVGVLGLLVVAVLLSIGATNGNDDLI